MSETTFTWVPFYKELAEKLLLYKDHRENLVTILKEIYQKNDEKLATILTDPETQTDVDPFTIFSGFNFGKQKDENRKKFCRYYHDTFHMTSSVPEDFNAIPVHQQDQKRFAGAQSDSKCFRTLWMLFELALSFQPDQDNHSEFIRVYNEALQLTLKKNGEVSGHQQNRLTKGLFYINPQLFISLDGNSRSLLGSMIEDERLSDHAKSIIKSFAADDTKIIKGEDYIALCLEMRRYLKEEDQSTLLDFSYRAFLANKDARKKQQTEKTSEKNKDWFPSLSQYNPGLTVENWKAILQDPEIFDNESWKTILLYYNIGGQATLSEIAEQDKSHANYHKSVCLKLAERVLKKTNCPPVPNEIKKNSQTWPVMFIGRKAEPNEKGIYIWKLRDELMQAIEEILPNRFQNQYSQTLLDSKNIIFHGAPGTGKTFLAKAIAIDIVSHGTKSRYDELTEDEKKQIEFVQFHPSYDYTDFVEGLRPVKPTDNSSGIQFELQPGIFKRFVDKARTNYENSEKTIEDVEKELSAQETLKRFLSDIEFDSHSFHTQKGNEFSITNIDDQRIHIFIPNNPSIKKLILKKDVIIKLLESTNKIEKSIDVTHCLGRDNSYQEDSYYCALYKEIKKKKYSVKAIVKQEKPKNYIFIIDEINRGEISKIFGELFFAIDPGYRGKKGAISTQYANLHDDSEGKFYIPENLYIIGTMNNIDRSVDSFDFAMRRRFRFIEITAESQQNMLEKLNDDKRGKAIERMNKLNHEIVNTPELNRNYQIGAAYFLKLNTLSFNQLWTDYIQPLLEEYVHGMLNEAEIMEKFAKAYGYSETETTQNDEETQDQG